MISNTERYDNLTYYLIISILTHINTFVMLKSVKNTYWCEDGNIRGVQSLW